MPNLQTDQATIHKFGARTYYVFPAPHTHANYVNRPSKYTEQKLTKVYPGPGTNFSARLLPEVHTQATLLMSSLLAYGKELGDNSLLSAKIQSGWREADVPSQGVDYLRNVEMVINTPKYGFTPLKFPKSLESEAQSVLGKPGDPRRQAFHAHLAEAPGWDAKRVGELFKTVDQLYVPRGGFNPHTTGLVFDLNFSIYHHKREKEVLVEAEDLVGEHPVMNEAALRSAAGMWLNTNSMLFSSDFH